VVDKFEKVLGGGIRQNATLGKGLIGKTHQLGASFKPKTKTIRTMCGKERQGETVFGYSKRRERNASGPSGWCCRAE